ncbi:uncharacterized protein LOC122253301 [Penaeus japonicus]|uniref:uncharacterized protein LOC122253301 n=1 Tax=Penaeus japonicus TaxID=27405 RepID=UPI001C70D74C|nr:uncharacterized protein LOC122253301 [Penaeus japonicus]
MWATQGAVTVAVALVVLFAQDLSAASLAEDTYGYQGPDQGPDRHRRALFSETFASPGNIVYSVLSFIMAGSLLFVNLFDPFRLSLIRFFDTAFGSRSERRRRRATHKSLEVYVAEAFDVFVASVDKLETLAASAKE